MLVLIPDAEQTSTRLLLGAILKQLNIDNRVKFYTSRGRGEATVQCLRVMLSRTRASLEKKGRAKKHFKLHASVFPYTEAPGHRATHDCVILWRSRSDNHELLETLEKLMVESNNG